jgi:hypothetical protein
VPQGLTCARDMRPFLHATCSIAIRNHDNGRISFRSGEFEVLVEILRSWNLSPYDLLRLQIKLMQESLAHFLITPKAKTVRIYICTGIIVS